MSEYQEEKVIGLLRNRGVDYRSVLRVVEVGSTAHGISVGSDDFDATVVRVEDFEEMVVGDHKRQSMQIRTAKDGERSGPKDIDLSVYTLRKFASLANSGNPSVLTAIFSESVHRDKDHVDWEQLGRVVASKKAGEAFLGYMRQQMERWVGIRGQKNVSRPELVEKYGFDTKYAAHVVRLGYQGLEYMEEGRFGVPMREEQANAIISLRTGGLEEYDAMAWAVDIEERLKVAIEESRLPEHPATRATRSWVLEQYRRLVNVE